MKRTESKEKRGGLSPEKNGKTAGEGQPAFSGDCTDKTSRPPLFAARDVFVYLFIIVLVCSLFFFFVILPKKTVAKGFIVTIEGKQAFYLEYARPESCRVFEDFTDVIRVSLTENTVTISSFTEENAVNVLAFDCEKRTVRMSQSNCSHLSPCTSFPAISETGTIICAPRKIIVKPVANGFIPSMPSTGRLSGGRLL